MIWWCDDDDDDDVVKSLTTVYVGVRDHVFDLVFGRLLPQVFHDREQLGAGDPSVFVFVEQTERITHVYNAQRIAITTSVPTATYASRIEQLYKQTLSDSAIQMHAHPKVLSATLTFDLLDSKSNENPRRDVWSPLTYNSVRTTVRHCDRSLPLYHFSSVWLWVTKPAKKNIYCVTSKHEIININTIQHEGGLPKA